MLGWEVRQCCAGDSCQQFVTADCDPLVPALSSVLSSHSLKSAIVGVLTPQTLVSATNQGSFVSSTLAVTHLPAYLQGQDSASFSHFVL